MFGPLGAQRFDRYVEFLAAHSRAATSAKPISAEVLPFQMYWVPQPESEEQELTDSDFIIPWSDDDD